MDKNKCEDKFSEPETEEHLNGKRDLYEWIKKQSGITNVILEGWISETKQRPDIIFEYNDKKYVIEYQCSPIASEYIERHQLYKSAGINDIWICGTEKYLGNGKRLNPLEKESCIYYDFKNKYIYKLDEITEKDFDEIGKMIHLRDELNFCSRIHVKLPYYKRNKYLKRKFHVMKNVYDYTNGYVNYFCTKSTSNSYHCIGSHYPSPTGRPSNKYPYPVKDYDFLRNYSYATCYKLSNVKLQNIDGGE